MCRWVIFSKGIAVASVIAGLAGSFHPTGAGAQTLLTQEEALRNAFPAPASIERRTAFLDESQIAEVARMAGPGATNGRAVVTYYVGSADGETLGAAYFDAHRVRTLREVLMIVVSAGGRIDRVEVLGFAEPPEYMPPDGWLNQFLGASLDAGASLKGDVPLITGATLTSRAVKAAVRRALALDAAIRPLVSEPAERRPGGRE